MNIQRLVFIVLVIVLLAASGIFGSLYFQERNKVDNSAEQSQEKTKNTIESVGKLILLPADDPSTSDDDPAVATIVDIDSLKVENAEFYADAENGDILIAYPNRAILYDPDRNIILNVAPIISSPEK